MSRKKGKYSSSISDKTADTEEKSIIISYLKGTSIDDIATLHDVDSGYIITIISENADIINEEVRRLLPKAKHTSLTEDPMNNFKILKEYHCSLMYSDSVLEIATRKVYLDLLVRASKNDLNLMSVEALKVVSKVLTGAKNNV